MMRQPRAKILLFCSALFFSIFVVELFFRIALPQPIPSTKHDLKRGRFTQAGIYKNKTPEFSAQVVVNQEGFVDHPWEKESGQSTALLVGDSFVQAAQVNLEDGWGRRLQSLLSKEDSDLKIISLGVPGAGIATEFELIKQYAPRLDAKIIYLSFLVDNDIFNNHPQLEAKSDKPFYTLKNDQLLLSWKQSPEQEHFLLQHLHSARWIYRNLWKQREQKRRMSLGEGVPLNFHVHNASSDPVWEESWDITREAFRMLSEYCREQNIELKIVLTPAYWQISSTKEMQLKKQFPLMKDWNIENYAYQRSATMLKELGVSVIDLYPEFRDHPDPDSLYFPIDSHWTKEGHALAAEILYTNWKDKR